MIKGKSYSGRLNVLLLFGEDMNRFEKELIIGYKDNEIGKIVEYKIRKTELTIYLEPNGSDEEPGILTYPKNEFIETAIEVETDRAIKRLQKNYNKRKDYSWHQWIFARILKCYLAALKVSEIDYPYKNTFIECFADVVNKSISLYEGIYGSKFNNLKAVNEQLQSVKTQKFTEFQLKPQIYKNIIRFTNGLITSGYIDEADSENFKKFLKGKNPTGKIDWKKEPRYFVYFINQLISIDNSDTPRYLKSPPKQQWKSLYSLFTFEKEDLPNKFYARFNKLGEKPKEEFDSLLHLLIK